MILRTETRLIPSSATDPMEQYDWPPIDSSVSTTRPRRPANPFTYGSDLNPALYKSSLPPYHPDYEPESDDDDIPLGHLHVRRDSFGEMAVRAIDREELLRPYLDTARDGFPDVLARDRYNVYEPEMGSDSDDSWGAD